MNNFFQKPVLAALPLVAAFMARPNEVNAQDCNAVRTALTPSNNVPSNLHAASQRLITLTHLDTLVPSAGPFPLNIPDELRPAQRCLDSLLTASDAGAAIAAGIGTEIRTVRNIRGYFVGTTEIDLDRANDDFAEINRRQDGGAIASGQEVVDLAKNYRDTLQAIKIMLDPAWTPPAEADSATTPAEPAVAAPAALAETQPAPQFTGEEMDDIVKLVNIILTTLDDLHINGVLPATHAELVNKIKDILAFVNRANANQPRLETALNELNNMKKELKAEQTRTRTGLFIALVLLTFVILVRQKQLSNRRQAELSGIQAELKEIRQAIADLPAEIKTPLKGTIASNLPPITPPVRASGAVPPHDPLVAAAASALTPGSGSSTSGGPPI